MKIRAALPTDNLICSKLILNAIHDLGKLYFNVETDEEAISLLNYFFKEKQNRFSYEFCDVVITENEVAGMLLSYPSDEMHDLSQNNVNYLKKYHSYKKDVDVLIKTKEAEIGEYYLDSIAISEKHLKKGFGSSLLSFGEKKAKELNFSKVSLLCDINNFNAKKLYLKLGYKEEGFTYIGEDKFFRMVKPL